ncbi:MAG: polyprenol monophosphomannose synthase [Chloroflexi bacterium HGW-Chloroflexi-5]|jgi:dolichol-phosphate mannosyltransferase|nr:MAG: polyprenol monophosphomannose synthase [Chloroflexi bacterium HGW-Chloroflexi-5]
MKIAVVIPTYNERENLPKITAQLMALPLDLRLLVIEDNSPDGTGKVADELTQQYPGRVSVMHRTGKLGLGTAYISGFKQLLTTDADAIGQMDADFSHPPEKLLEMITALQDVDIAAGSRYIPGGSLDEKWPFWRKALSGFGNIYARTILGMSLKDVTGGFRLWKRQTLEAFPLDEIKANGYVFQVEMAYVAQKLGFRFKEIPIHFNERIYGQSKMNFRIQVEAALRVWELPGRYRHLKKIK